MKLFDLIDYKGKYTIIQDQGWPDEEGMDVIVGNITKEMAIADARERLEACSYYGIPPYIGKDPDLNKIYNENIR